MIKESLFCKGLMGALRNALSKTLYSLVLVQPRWTGNVAAWMQKCWQRRKRSIQTNKNQLKITKETLISNCCCSCVRLLVHRFTFSMLCKNIRVKMLSMIIFLQILFVWQENDLVFSSEFEKIALKTKT